jgi:hypothetical protein
MGSGFARYTAGVRVHNKARKPYLDLLHPLLHKSASTVHCATQDPDSPQFFAQEKLTELQSEMHFAKSRV